MRANRPRRKPRVGLRHATPPQGQGFDHRAIGQSTELVCFGLGERLALDRVEELGADRAAIAALPLGSFGSYNRLSGGRLAARVF